MAWTTPETFVAGTTLTAATLNAQIRDNLNAAFPVGSIHYFMQAGTTTETLINGFALEMNAVSVLRATYANLNTLLGGLGYPFGTVDGTHLTLPDAKGRALHHAASGGHVDVDALGDSDGLGVTSRSPLHNSTSNLTLPNHAHADTISFSDSGHVHTDSGASGAVGASTHATSSALGGGATVATASGTAVLVKSGSVGNPSTNPAIGGTIGVGGTRPNDLTPWLVAGVYAVKT